MTLIRNTGKIRVWVLVAALVLLWTQPILGREPAANLQIDQVTFARDKRLVHVYLTMDKFPESNVKPDQSHVRVEEDGVAFTGSIRVDLFQASGRRLGYVLALDTRENLPSSLTMIIQGFKELIQQMGFRHPGAIIRYTGQPTLIAGPTASAERLLEKLAMVRPTQGSPKLVDGLCFAAQVIESIDKDTETPVDRRALILLTDGLDSGGLFHLASCADLLLDSGITLHVIGYGLAEAAPLRRIARLAEQTGGSYRFVSAPEKIPAALSALSDRFKNQIILTFKPEVLLPDGQPHRLQVSVLRDRTWVSATREFLAPKLKWTWAWQWAAVVVALLAGAILLLMAPWPRRRTGTNRRRAKTIMD